MTYLFFLRQKNFVTQYLQKLYSTLFSPNVVGKLFALVRNVYIQKKFSQ